MQDVYKQLTKLVMRYRTTQTGCYHTFRHKPKLMVEKQTWIENGLVYCPGTANYAVMMKISATILKI